MKMVQETPSSP